MKCYCQRFDVPECCKKYLEDPQGSLVHTETVCYEWAANGEHKLLYVPIEFVLFSGTLEQKHPTPDPSVFPGIDHPQPLHSAECEDHT